MLGPRVLNIDMHTAVLIFKDNMVPTTYSAYNYVPKYKDRLYINIKLKRFLYFGTY